MKRNFLPVLLSASLLMLGYACSSDDVEAPITENQTEVSFTFMMPADESTKAEAEGLPYEPWTEYQSCLNGFNDDGTPSVTDVPVTSLRARIKGEVVGDQTGVVTPTFDVTLPIVERANDTWVTDPTLLDARDYQITSIEIISATTPVTVYYSGVDAGATFAPYVGATLPQTFTVEKYAKPIIEVWVLCARGRNPIEFGKPKFDLNRVEVSCVPIFVDVCDVAGEDFVASGTISLKKLDKSGEPTADEFTGTAVTDNLASGSISYLCFADNLDIDDAEEWFLVTITANNFPSGAIVKSGIYSLEQIKKYKSSTYWNSQYNYLDILICDKAN